MTGVKLDLSGAWEFCLDAGKEGIQKKYYGQELEDVIVLPATTAEAEKGIRGESKETGYLTEPYHFEGYAWYARTIEIPKEHMGDLAQLVIERTRVSYVWIDGHFVGTQDSFAAAHRYDLTEYLTDVSHRLTVMVSNTDYKTGGGHMTSPDTQTNWNGMLGEIALVLEPAVRVENLRVDAKAADRSVEVRFMATYRKNETGREGRAAGAEGISEAGRADCADGIRGESRTGSMGTICGEDRTYAEGGTIPEEWNVTACCTVQRRTSGAEADAPLLREYREILLRKEPAEYVWKMEIPAECEIALWNEYTPNLYEVTVQIMDSQGKGAGTDGNAWRIPGCARTTVGFRDLHIGRIHENDSGAESDEARIFYLNDLPVMLRGKHDGMIFPITGYAPMNKEAWRSVFRIAKEYGINHYRFHTCCPPEAAFAAADELGIYLAPELPFWGTVAGEEETERGREGRMWLLDEGFRILREFGNHPSFVIFSLGNELWGDQQVLNDILGQYKAADGRRLYVQGSNNFQFCPAILENDDFFSGVRFAKERLIRGSYAMCDAPQGHIQTRMPDNCHSYDEAIRPQQTSGRACLSGGIEIPQSGIMNVSVEYDTAQKSTGEVEIQFGTGTKKVKAEKGEELIPQVPVVSHEIGQYEFYPDYDEIGKYTGVLQPENLRIFRERLAGKGMRHMAKPFFLAAGQLAVACYKRELETAFRSRELAGFQLLDLQDFTGQGTALVGILNAFMENKGLISAEEWREFCNDRVIMLSFPTYVYETGGVFDYEALLCNMRPEWADCETGMEEQIGVRFTVELSERGSGKVLAQTVHEGIWVLTRRRSFGYGSLEIPAGDEPIMLRVAVTAAVCGSDRILAKNHYDIYAYPPMKKQQLDSHIPVTVTGDKTRMLAGLQAGERVLFFGNSIEEAYSMEGTYCTDFWCYPMFASISESMGRPLPIGTMGLCMDQEHPIFTKFPTEGYTTPQWWRIVTGARVAILDELQIEPIVWMVDHFSRNHKLGLVYEAKVGAGSLLVCQADLSSQDSPESNRFYDSLLAYVSSEKFQPQKQIAEEWLEKVY